MKTLMNDVKSFHRQCGQPIAESPQTLPQTERINLRRDLHTEEYEELDDALEDLAHGGDRESLIDVADGIADLIYVLVGTALELGIPLDRVWDEVHASNLRKTGGKRRADGKILKPEGWVGPDVRKAIWGDDV